MTKKPVIPRTLATRDVEKAIEYYLEDGTVDAALGFIDALEAAYDHIARHPASGSPRLGHELDLPELRSWPLNTFSYLIFYLDRSDHIDVWRVLHQKRDIPSSLQSGD
ncbi:MAG: type II toxin-antitoxin system RelE/ParE family toxin [Thermoanaerobaculales bacterium]|nr:type II toxin-antitoxin system RelE/ParE family toxin [Thermoanaerobaculales bacterium]